MDIPAASAIHKPFPASTIPGNRSLDILVRSRTGSECAGILADIGAETSKIRTIIMKDYDPPSITPDIKEASNFLGTFGENHSFQVLPESGKSAPVMQHGTFTKMSGWLISKNRQGNGVFFMVNRGDGRGRNARVR